MLLQWRNMKEIVDLSASGCTVSEEQHCTWFQSALLNDNISILIIEGPAGPIGQIRFDRKNPDACFMSIYFTPGEVGRGRGADAIRAGLHQALTIWPDLVSIFAIVRECNARSIQAFKRAGFVLTNLRCAGLEGQSGLLTLCCRVGDGQERPTTLNEAPHGVDE
jgi:RimJ/RimL family protein N-acetyltransferase